MYRQLVYASNTRFALEGFEMNALTARRPLAESVRFSGGNAKEPGSPGSSLIIVRQNEEIQGREVFLPSRLLRGQDWTMFCLAKLERSHVSLRS